MAKKTSLTDVLAKFATKDQVHVEVRPDVFNEIWGGVHLGSVYSIWGEAGCGKTTLTLQVIRSMLQQGYKGIIIDVEKAINESQQKSFGIYDYVQSGELLIVTVTDYKEVEEIIVALPESGLSFLMIDSMSVIRPFVKDDLMVEDIRPGIKSMQESTVLGKLKNIAYHNDIACFLLNHARANIQITGASRYAPQTKSAGGYAMEHIPDVITKIQTHGKIKGDGDAPIGVEVTVITEKNKFAVPFQPRREKLIYGKGIDAKMSLIERAIELGVIVQSGAYFKVPGMDSNVRGRQALYDLPKETYLQIKEAMLIT